MRTAVDRPWVDQSDLIDDEAIWSRFAEKAGFKSFVASRPGLFDAHEYAICVAIDSNFDDSLPMTALFPFSPQSLSRAAVVGRKSCLECLLVGFVVHPRHHQNRATRGVLGDGWQEAIGTPGEIWAEDKVT